MRSNPEKTAWKRSRVIAILLALFFGPWTWLYTYRRDTAVATIGISIDVSAVILFGSARLGVEIYPPVGFDDSLAYI